MRDLRCREEVDRDACGVGFIAQLGGTSSRDVVERALTALGRLSHRGGLDADGSSGDGAGLLLPIPEKFIRERAHEAGIDLPQQFGLGMAFLPRENEAAARDAVEQQGRKSGLRCLGWRNVPTHPSVLGPRAAATLPLIHQCFFAAESSPHDFEQRLYLFRKRAECQSGSAYFCSLSSRTLVYKGLLSPSQIRLFFEDLDSPDFQVPFAIFHQRYSTNTRPAWQLAQPFRFVAHNGEINTIGANRRWTRAREQSVRHELHAGEWFRTLEDGVSDSASFDNALEALLRRGYSLHDAMLRMVPPAWESDPRMVPELRGFLENEARVQEPWDGPAALVYTDGLMVGAKLDRNGLRPLRYTLTTDGLLVLGSETGVADFEGKRIAERQRLGPGEMLLVDARAGKIHRPGHIAGLLENRTRHAKRLSALRLEPRASGPVTLTAEPRKIAAALGWTDDQYRLLFQPLGVDGKEATWSMGDDAPPAFISTQRRPLWDYCKQRFAQVTNPPIDPLREAHVMTLDVYLGEACVLPSPLMNAAQMDAFAARARTRIHRIDITYDAAQGVAGACEALDRVRQEAAAAAREMSLGIVLHDRATCAGRAALPALLAASAAWKAAVGEGGWAVPLVIESGQVIETHHLAMVIACGASAVYPYLALEMSESLKAGGAARYRQAVEAGFRKVLARMGISSVFSYRNSHLFDVIGLEEDFCDEFFEDASIVPGGKTLAQVLEDSLARHANAFATETVSGPGAAMQDAGLYRFRQTGERHASSPDLVRHMHRYIQSPTAENYAAYAALAETREPVAIRDLVEFIHGTPVALADVEDEKDILKRFSAQAMSLGALGPEAHRTLAIAMNRMGARSNTGEGGEDPEMYRSDPEASNRVKQVASARFGVTAEYLVRADELEIKMAQGSKPGEGGQLPATKVTPFIARLRHAVAGMMLISPPPHHDIYSIEDLAQLIYDLRSVNPRARIGVKLVSGAGVGIIAAGVAKAGADVITIAGFDGGTGASPLTSIKNTGLPWEAGLRDAHAALVRSGFRDRVRLRVDGGFKFGRDVVIAALLGADEFGFGTAALLALGCVMARQCHLNTCPVGIATQDEKYRARFEGKPEMVIEYFRGVAGEVRQHLAKLGARTLSEISGSVERLRPRDARAESRLGWLFAPAPKPAPEHCTDRESARHSTQAQRMNLEISLSEAGTGVRERLARVADLLELLPPMPLRFTIANSDRSIGAHLSGQILRRTAFEGLGEEKIDCEFRGTAGQSFGAFLVPGVSFRLQGEANDYVGKGLCGGAIAIHAGEDACERGDVLAGNTVLYGATSGELYIAGRAGERFGVRNSGALAVVEGVGQHGCEYMTAGIAIVLGPAGRNFGSGMTGGLAYTLRETFEDLEYHKEFLRPGDIGDEEEEWLRSALRQHIRRTGSPRARLLVRRLAPLPLVRLEPLVLPCPVSQTWAPFVTAWEGRQLAALGKAAGAGSRAASRTSSEETLSAGEPIC
ncbi:MAG: glutamate synthase large subunit [Candidatus Acidiferrales bacterium]